MIIVGLLLIARRYKQRRVSYSSTEPRSELYPRGRRLHRELRYLRQRTVSPCPEQWRLFRSLKPSPLFPRSLSRCPEGRMLLIQSLYQPQQWQRPGSEPKSTTERPPCPGGHAHSSQLKPLYQLWRPVWSHSEGQAPTSG